jgi:two-component system sensor histidine kinase UhpB
MNLKLRLNLLITALLLLMLLLGAINLTMGAREDVHAEIESTAVLVTHLLDAEVAYLAATAGMESVERPFRLEDLRYIRHFKIEYYDTRGRLRESNYDASQEGGPGGMPAWFDRAMLKLSLPWHETRRPVVVNGRHFGALVIRPDPSYEIAEVWKDTVGLLSLVAMFFVAVNVMVYWAVARALRPIDNIWQALNELEQGNLQARLPSFRLPELTRLSEKFNRMAETLQQTIKRNHKLTQQLINLQEAERKSLARDLHDELGQSLTAIKMDGLNLLEMSKQGWPDARESAQAIVDVTRQVMQQMRTMLQRLRPEVLDGLGLHAALSEMMSTWHQRHRNIACVSRLSEELGNLDELTNITAYRVVQECLTNVARHAQARRVEVTVHRIGNKWSEPSLEIVVTDDGIGFDEHQDEGFGVSGMRERVEGLGGKFSAHRNANGGMRIAARIPIKEAT